MSEKKVRVVSTETVPGENRPIVASTVIWSSKCEEITDAVKSLQEYARENDWNDLVGMRISSIQELYNAGTGAGAYATPGSENYYIVYGTYVRYSVDD